MPVEIDHTRNAVFELVCLGHTAKEIAKMLEIPLWEVRTIIKQDFD